jgi:hypothetical protein
MSTTGTGHPVEWRALGATLLSCCVLVLFALDSTEPGPTGSVAPGSKTTTGWRESVGRCVDSLFVLYGINSDRVRTREVKLPDRSSHRIEQRSTVPPDFVSVEFNHDLNTAVRPFGARIVATERVREGIVTMHIVRSGRTVRSIIFLTDPDRGSNQRM